MNHRELDDNQLPERYLLGQLSADETARFEEHVLECRECLERLEVAERFQAALRGVAAEEAARTGARLGVLAALARLGRGGWALAAVCAAALLVPSGVLMVRIDRLEADRSRLEEERREAFAPRVHPSVLRLSPERSAPGVVGPSSRITLTPRPEWIVLVLEVEGASEVRACRVTLEGPDGSRMWESDGAERAPGGSVVLSLHSSIFAAGDHVLELQCPSPTGGVVQAPFSLRVIRDP